MTKPIEKPDELTEREWDALRFMINERNSRPPSIVDLSRHLGHTTRTFGWTLVTNLVKKGYLDTNIKATPRAIGVTRGASSKSNRRNHG